MQKFLFTLRDAARVPAMILYYLHLRSESPQEGEYNPLQKMVYTSIFLILTPLVLLSGLAMSPQLDVAFNWLPAMFGGRQSARTVHFILAFGFVAFTFGHVFMVLTTGVLSNMRSMITGWYREKVPAYIETPHSVPPPGPELAKTLPVEEKPLKPPEEPAATTSQPAATTSQQLGPHAAEPETMDEKRLAETSSDTSIESKEAQRDV